MEKEQLYTKYKFTENEYYLYSQICKVKPEELEAKFDTLSYEEKRTIYQISVPMESFLRHVYK